MLMRRLLVPAFALCTAAGATFACSDGATDPAAALRGDCAAPPEVSAVPVGVAGEWWTDGASPPTVSVEQDGTALRATLSFSGVQRPGGTGSVSGGCVQLVFPSRPGVAEPAYVLDGRLVSGGVMQAVLRSGDAGAMQLRLQRQVR